ncbi:MAG TPA: low molecular weight phosphatase family protein [Actinomycetota bacterium]|jgi:protein-tyrosine phosphatase|nr:low molecular weight phosphatase family protein [Actinomycetota bacterium]
MPHVLVVCTGNICRSPIAEGFLRAAFERRLGPQAPAVTSAGLVARDGNAAEPEAVRAAAEHGVDISDHAARRLTGRMMAEADLVICMTSGHRDRIVEALPDALARTFTLKELVFLLESLPDPAAHAPADRLSERVAAAHELREHSDRPVDEDIGDPLGLSIPAFRATAIELEGLCTRLADGLFPEREERRAAGHGGA